MKTRPSQTVILYGGDITVEHYSVDVYYLLMEIEEIKLIFELYNRFNNEYDNLDEDEFENGDYSYLGLVDGLESHVLHAKRVMKKEVNSSYDYSSLEDDFNKWAKNKGEDLDDEGQFGLYAKFMIDKDPKRYAVLNKYIENKSEFIDIFEKNCISKNTFYYTYDDGLCSDKEFDMGGFNHWYEVCESYEGEFTGFEKWDYFDLFNWLSYGWEDDENNFIAFADLTYGN